MIMTTTSGDNEDEESQEDRLDINDIPSEHPGIENVTEDPFLHMVAELARPLLPSTTRAGDDIDPYSTLSLGPTSSLSPIMSTQLFEHHCHGIPHLH